MGMDAIARGLVKVQMETLLKDPKMTESGTSKILKAQGIESNTETILSFQMGVSLGMVQSYYGLMKHRTYDSDELKDLFDIMKHRTLELREAFKKNRNNT